MERRVGLSRVPDQVPVFGLAAMRIFVRPAAKAAAVLGIAAVFVFVILCHFTLLDWGTPNLKKHRQIFAAPSELEKWVPIMIDQRKKHYAAIDDLLDPEKPFNETYQQLFHSQEKNPPFSKLSQEWVLDRLRGHLLGVTNSDEQNTLVALSQLNPAKLDFNPGLNTFYGGFYYYTCGAFLFLGKLASWISLNTDPAFYFFNPEETSRMYLLIRLVGALSVFLSCGLLLAWIGRSHSFKTGLLAVSFLAVIPLLVPYSHMAKAHNYGMFLFLLGFYFSWKAVSKPVLWNTVLGAGLLGLSAGSIITNLPIGIVIFFIEWARNDWRLAPVFKSRNFYLACLVFFAAFALTNFYIFLNFENFQRTILSIKTYTRGYDEYGTLNLGRWVPFLKEIFTQQIHVSILPIFITGCVLALTRKDKLLIVMFLSFLALTFMNILTTRHPGVNIRVFPLIAVLCAYSVNILLAHRSLGMKILAGSMTGAALLFSGLQSYFYRTLLKEPSNLTLAGDWINANIPAGETIGVVNGQIPQGGFPPIQFLNYALVHFPAPEKEVSFSQSPWPVYVVTQDDRHPLLRAHYRVIQNWKRPVEFLGISFESKWAASGNPDIFIFSKK